MLVNHKTTVALLTGNTVMGRAVMRPAEIESLEPIHFAKKIGT